LILTELLRKWFGLPEPSCNTCEALRHQLASSERERRELLQRVLTPPEPIIEPEPKEEYKPVTPQFIPWRLRKEMLEAEDRKKAQLMQEKNKEIAELEKELGVTGAEGA